jgi:hypothetical protein
MSTQLNKLAIINNSVDGSGDFNALSETKTFSVVQEGAAEASRQVISIEPNTQVIENNREVITSKVYNITATGLYSTASRTQLNTWATDQTSLVFSGIGLDGSILQAEGTLQVVTQFEDNASFRFTSSREAVGGYNSSTGKHTSEMSYSKNGLSLFNWQEGSTTDLAAGWTNDGVESLDFTAGVQELTDATVGGGNIYRDIHFPFPSKSVTFSIDVTDDSTDNAEALIGIQCYDSSNNTTGAKATTAIDGTGTTQVTKTLVAACEYVRVSVEIGDTDTLDFQNPTLQLSTDYKFVEFNT